MGELKENVVLVFVEDTNGEPIHGATVRGFDGEEEIGIGTTSGRPHEPVRLQFPEVYTSVRLVVDVPGCTPQSKTVNTDAGTVGFEFQLPSPPETKTKPEGANTEPESQHSGGTHMEGRVLTALGKIAGIGGIVLGVFFFLFRGVLEQRFLPNTGLSQEQAYHVILALMILTFGIAVVGLIA
jgi:hypothetical protein